MHETGVWAAYVVHGATQAARTLSTFVRHPNGAEDEPMNSLIHWASSWEPSVIRVTPGWLALGMSSNCQPLTMRLLCRQCPQRSYAAQANSAVQTVLIAAPCSV